MVAAPVRSRAFECFVEVVFCWHPLIVPRFGYFWICLLLFNFCQNIDCYNKNGRSPRSTGIGQFLGSMDRKIRTGAGKSVVPVDPVEQGVPDDLVDPVEPT